jgi:hypothetical protein
MAPIPRRRRSAHFLRTGLLVPSEVPLCLLPSGASVDPSVGAILSGRDAPALKTAAPVWIDAFFNTANCGLNPFLLDAPNRLVIRSLSCESGEA